RADTPEELDSVRVVLADRAVFENFGIGRPAFLDNFTFDIQRNGIQGVIRIRSTAPVVEPFVSLLVDVSWPSGRLFREYTVLLDPPAFASETAPVVSQPAVTPAARPTQKIERPQPAESSSPAP